jgi:hypothetical protein
MQTRQLLAAMAIIAASVTPVAAQGTARLSTLSINGMPGAPDPARVSAQLATADSLAFAGKNGEARARYREIIEQLRSAGQYPREALWHLANSYLESNESDRVAGIMDELAAAAAKYGDPTTELNANFESAVLYQRMRYPTKAADRLNRVKELLQSPAITDDAKRQVEGRMAPGK